MVKHIVMWNFREEVAEADKANLGKVMEGHLKALENRIPGLLKVNFIAEPMKSSTHELALICELESEESLAVYQKHPEHVKVADDFVRPYVHQRCCLDYEV